MNKEKKMIWAKVVVDWCEEWNCWMVCKYDHDGNHTNLSEHHRKEWAIDDAKIYAFDTQCGEQRSPKIEIYSKKFKLLKTIYENN